MKRILYLVRIETPVEPLSCACTHASSAWGVFRGLKHAFGKEPEILSYLSVHPGPITEEDLIREVMQEVPGDQA